MNESSRSLIRFSRTSHPCCAAFDLLSFALPATFFSSVFFSTTYFVSLFCLYSTFVPIRKTLFSLEYLLPKEMTSFADRKLTPAFTIDDCESEVFTVRYSPDDRFVAAGCGDGTVRVYNAENGRLTYTLNGGKPILTPRASGSDKEASILNGGLPTTAMRFRPLGASKTRNVLLVANADGSVSHWHVTSGKCLHSTAEEGNQILCIDYNKDGSSFATAGKDHTVRVYDEATKSLIAKMEGGLGTITPGHSNRIFSLKFNPVDANIIISGGWDNTVQIWDMRVGHAVRSIYGPHICGDAVDINAEGNTILTGSWRAKDQLQLWDYSTGELIESVSYGGESPREPSMIYAAQFSKGSGDLLAAGGSGSNDAKVFDRSNGNKLVGTIRGFGAGGVFSLDFNCTNSRIAVGGGDKKIAVYSIH